MQRLHNPIFLTALILTAGWLMAWPATAQMKHPVKWKFEAYGVSRDEAHLSFTAHIEKGWHVYAQRVNQEGESGGPKPTRFEFSSSAEFLLLGNVKEPRGKVSMDSTFQIMVKWFEDSVEFIQPVRLLNSSSLIRGTVEFMVCNDHECLPPETIQFSLAVKAGELPARTYSKRDSLEYFMASAISDIGSTTDESSELKEGTTTQTINTITIATAAGGWKIFFFGFIGGLLALLMPCIFPMLPFTVGYFIKRGGSSGKSIGLALVYGLSIMLIYVLLGLTITFVFGSDALNDLSSSGAFNLFFFALLIVFGASFLGAFELALPGHWISKADARSDQTGLSGLFFMAATLALVSFSCTGPIIGTLLVDTASKGTLLGPAIGMFGFSFAMALPFTLFAMFPGWLKRLPKSGGWMNTLKVTLGFLELALALKFLSNVDLAYHWEWFDREVFLVLWVIIFLVLGLYLLGFINLQDTPKSVGSLSPFRLFVAIITLSFSLYLVPGLWGAPLKAVSAFLPPQHTQDFDLYSNSSTRNLKHGLDRSAASPLLGGAQGFHKKYGELFKAPLNLDAYFDFEEGMAFAKSMNKPVLIDFTGHACVNCRKMETMIWPEPGVIEKLRDRYVIIQLYVDDKTELPVAEQQISLYSGKRLVTIGNKWSDFQAATFNTNSQPYYVLLDTSRHQLVVPKGADYDAASFGDFLDQGIQTFELGSGTLTTER